MNQVIKKKILNCAIVIASFCGYMEWGKNQSSFIIEAEVKMLLNFYPNITKFIHPFIIIPLIGQLLTLQTVLQNKPNRKQLIIGISMIAFLFVLLFSIGVIGLNLKIILSTLPFFITSYLALIN